MFQSPFRLPMPFLSQSAGTVVRTCRNTLPWWNSAVQVQWIRAVCAPPATDSPRTSRNVMYRMPAWMARPRGWLNRRGLSDGSSLRRIPRHAELAADAIFDRFADLGVVLQELLGVFAAL